jgi:hypothetical protein
MNTQTRREIVAGQRAPLTRQKKLATEIKVGRQAMHRNARKIKAEECENRRRERLAAKAPKREYTSPPITPVDWEARYHELWSRHDALQRRVQQEHDVVLQVQKVLAPLHVLSEQLKALFPWKIISQSDIKKFYTDVAHRRYEGNDAARAAREQEIFAAQQSGRIIRG